MRITGWKAGGDTENTKFSFLSEAAASEGNWTTMVVGKNGTKKSLLLRALVDGFLGNEDFRHGVRPPVPVSVDFDSNCSEKGCVIAVSGTPFDRFPRQNRYVLSTTSNKYDSSIEYYYLGLAATNGSIGTTHGVRTLAHLLFEVSVDDIKTASSVMRVLRFLRFENNVAVVLRRNSLMNFSKKDAENSKGAVSGKLNFDKFKEILNEKIVSGEGGTLTEQLKYISNKISDRNYQKNLRLSLANLPGAIAFNFSKDGVSVVADSSKIKIEVSEVLTLLKAGILMASHIGCYQKANHAESSEAKETLQSDSDDASSEEKSKILAETDMSSGQWYLLSSMLGLALTVTDNTLIVIDEPENSLHPDWQRSYIQLLDEVIAHREGCHAVIATHSPLIASGVDGKSGNAIRMVRTGALLGDSEPLQIAFGWDASDVYNEIFGLAAPRASRFTSAADRALELLRDGDVDSDELPGLLDELTEAAKSLPDTDTMRQVVNAMVKANKALISRQA